MPHNLNLITQAAWRVTIVDFVARMLGVLIHVEGMPFGSARNIKSRSVTGGTGGRN